ncbi:MAG: hypothetical protein JO029_13730 [Candidatus Eremiobacteraeota bacterium]|nr:hypothetical protein [Candidatus Eremiobacteraeota bacterium]
MPDNRFLGWKFFGVPIDPDEDTKPRRDRPKNTPQLDIEEQSEPPDDNASDR